MRKYLVIGLLAIIGYFLIGAFAEIPFGANRIGDPAAESTVSGYYLNNTVPKTKVANVITAIVVNYRGFDTLGEVTVLFLAVTGLGSILFRRKEEGEADRIQLSASPLINSGAKLLYPMVVLLGIYVFIHGHLTPGGGFQGGAIIATGFLLMMISYRDFKVSHGKLAWVESLAGITFVTLGFWGLFSGGTFLENFLPNGEVNQLISGGVIPVIYIAVGLKVAAELIGVLDTLLKIKPEQR
ncbi:MAG: Na(+)/H(+) antiporter subunit B [Bacteroidota bacterium]